MPHQTNDPDDDRDTLDSKIELPRPKHQDEDEEEAHVPQRNTGLDDEDQEDFVVEEIFLDDLDAMEGPDA